MFVGRLAREECWETVAQQTRARGCSALGQSESIGTGRWQLRSKASAAGTQRLLGPMAEPAPEDRGLRTRAAPQDASVSHGQAPRCWWGRGSDLTFLAQEPSAHQQSETVAAVLHFLGVEGLRGADSGVKSWRGTSEATPRPELCSYREMSLLFTNEAPSQECALTHWDSGVSLVPLAAELRISEAVN